MHVFKSLLIQKQKNNAIFRIMVVMRRTHKNIRLDYGYWAWKCTDQNMDTTLPNYKVIDDILFVSKGFKTTARRKCEQPEINWEWRKMTRFWMCNFAEFEVENLGFQISRSVMK